MFFVGSFNSHASWLDQCPHSSLDTLQAAHQEAEASTSGFERGAERKFATIDSEEDAVPSDRGWRQVESAGCGRTGQKDESREGWQS